MPIYITQGRYTRDAIKGMITPPPAISRQTLNRPAGLERTSRFVIDAGRGNKPKHRNVIISLNKSLAHDPEKWKPVFG